MMGIVGFKTKKELKGAIGQSPRFIETSIFGSEYRGDGHYVIVGPSPTIRKWYAEVFIKDGKIAKVK